MVVIVEMNLHGSSINFYFTYFISTTNHFFFVEVVQNFMDQKDFFFFPK